MSSPLKEKGFVWEDLFPVIQGRCVTSNIWKYYSAEKYLKPDEWSLVFSICLQGGVGYQCMDLNEKAAVLKWKVCKVTLCFILCISLNE